MYAVRIVSAFHGKSAELCLPGANLKCTWLSWIFTFILINTQLNCTDSLSWLTFPIYRELTLCPQWSSKSQSEELWKNKWWMSGGWFCDCRSGLGLKRFGCVPHIKTFRVGLGKSLTFSMLWSPSMIQEQQACFFHALSVFCNCAIRGLIQVKPCTACLDKTQYNWASNLVGITGIQLNKSSF